MSIYLIKEVSYSRVYATRPGQPRKVEYLPIVSIIHDENGETRSKVYLEKVVESKKYYIGWIEGKTYIAGITSEGYEFFNEKGKLTGSVTIASVGQVVQANEDSIYCIKGLVISNVSTDGKVLGSRELPAEEYALWVSQ